MSRIAVAVLALGFSAGLHADEGATRMGKEALQAFLPGTRVTHTAPSTGSLRRWTNEPDGKFVASTNNKGYGSITGTEGATGRGTWLVNDDGKYCVAIDWRRVDEKWWPMY